MNTKRKWWTIVLVGLITAIADALFFEKYFFEIKQYFIGKKDGKNRITLVLLTDLHFKRFLDPSYKRLADKINTIRPDLILIAGDIIDEDGMYAPAKRFFELLDRAIPKAGILGNHDHKNRVRLQTYKQLFTKNNGYLLVNESRLFLIAGRRLMITGTDDFIEGNPCFHKAVKDVGREDNHLLLIHSPLQQETILKEIRDINQVRPEESKLNIRYIFAGHNHGGQVKIFGFVPILPKKAGNYLNGWYNSKPPYLYLSKGFGTSTLPFRFGARSEVTVFYLGV